MRVKLGELEKYREFNLLSDRLYSQLQCAVTFCDKVESSFYPLMDRTLEKVIDYLSKSVLSTSFVEVVEEDLKPISLGLKQYKAYFIAHAHIDMNWRWGYDETVSITLDTFRSMLNLMEEYPEFKFSQSQASCYEIVEKYDQSMLQEIKKRVAQGRWEVTASQWVEGDKNLPSSEGLTRQLLNAKKYLSNLLGVSEESLSIDFEPDTFGHSAYVPEILASGGVKYYYHCRGYDKHVAYRWKGCGENEVLVYRDPLWYLTFGSKGIHGINGKIGKDIIDICEQNQMKEMMRCYGVGDHGGGPSRADIEFIKEISTWPIFPDIQFATMKEYYETLEKRKEELPIVTGELNPVFTGCYTSQSRIKMANRIGERLLTEAEVYGALLRPFGYRYNKGLIEKSWRKILFSHFHDILPGSGIIDTREYCMGNFQEVVAAAQVTKKGALLAVVNQIDTSEWIQKDVMLATSRSEGAGVGYGIRDFKVSQVDRSHGLIRVIHIFNNTQYDREELVDAAIWHYPGEISKCRILDEMGREISYIVDEKSKHFEGYDYYTLTLDVSVPAFGYRSYLLTYDDTKESEVRHPLGPRVERVDDLSFENEYIKGYLTIQGEIGYLEDKITSTPLVTEPTGVFKYILESPEKGMSAWIVGNYGSVIKCKDVRLKGINRNKIRTKFAFEMQINDSSIYVDIILEKYKPYLSYEIQCHFREWGNNEKGWPQLQFEVAHSYEAGEYVYDIPYGCIARKAINQDLPAIGMTVAKNTNGSNLMILADTKSGFRGTGHELIINLLRASAEPDPYPEFGLHKMKFSVGCTQGVAIEQILKTSTLYQHALDVLVDKPKKGIIDKIGSWLNLNTNEFVITCIKEAVEDNSLIIRGMSYKNLGKVELRLDNRVIKEAYHTDILEHITEGRLELRDKNIICFNTKANRIMTIKVVLEN